MPAKGGGTTRRRRYTLPRGSGTERSSPQPRRTQPTYRESSRQVQRFVRRRVTRPRGPASGPTEGQAPIRGRRFDRPSAPALVARPQEGLRDSRAIALSRRQALRAEVQRSREVSHLLSIAQDKRQPASRRLAAARVYMQRHNPAAERALKQAVRQRAARGLKASLEKRASQLPRQSAEFKQIQAQYAKAGFDLPGNPKLLLAPYHVGRAYYENPVETLRSDARFARDVAVGGAAAAYRAVKDPVDAAKGLPETLASLPKAVRDDLSYRYDPLVRGDTKEFRRRVNEQGGAVYALDFAVAGSAVSKGLGAAARLSRPGSRLNRLVSEPRARIQVAPGEVRRQRDETRKVAPSIFRVAAQKNRDRSRAKRFEAGEVGALVRAEEFKEAGGGFQPGVRRFNQPPERHVLREAATAKITQAGGRIRTNDDGSTAAVTFTAHGAARSHPAVFDQVRTGLERAGFDQKRVGGNLVFYAPKVVVPRTRMHERALQRRVFPERKGKAVQEIRELAGTERRAYENVVGAAAKLFRVKGLSEEERRALVLVGTGRLPADKPEQAVRAIDQIIERIETDRSRPVTVHQEDNLTTLRFLRDNAEKVFTPRLREAVEQISAQAAKGEAENPFRVLRQFVEAKYGPAALERGLSRGEVEQENFDPRASAKSIERQRQKRNPPTRGGMVSADRNALRLEGESLSRQIGALNERMNPRSQEIEALARRADKAETPEQERALRETIGRIADANEADWIEANKLGRRLEEVRQERLEIASGKVITGRPDEPAGDVVWYHGSKATELSGHLTAEGQYNDLGVYLTSDPGYAKGYRGSEDPESGRPSVVAKIRVEPKQVLETRFGRVDPDKMAAVVQGVIERAHKAGREHREKLIEEGMLSEWRQARDAEERRAARGGRAPREVAPPEAFRRKVEERTRARSINERDLAQLGEWRQRLLKDEEYRRAVSKGEGDPEKIAEWLAEWKGPPGSAGTGLDGLLFRDAAHQIASLEGRAGTGLYHRPVKEELMRLGYDSIRKVDQYADALVVLDENLVNRGAGVLADRGQEFRAAAASVRPENTREFVDRIRAENAKLGIDHKLLFTPSEELHQPKFASYTAGGARSPAPSKKRLYVLQRQGVERLDPQIIFEGILRNHRSRIAAQLVVDVAERVAHPRYQDMDGLPLARAIEAEGFAPGDVSVFFPGIYRDRLTGRQVGAAKGAGIAVRPAPGLRRQIDSPEHRRAEEEATDIEGTVPGMNEALDGSIVESDVGDDLISLLTSDRFAREKGMLIPRTVADQMRRSSAVGSTSVGRVFEKLKTMQSRAVLGAGNVAWVQADTIANTAVAMLLGGVSPAALVKAQVWYRRLPPDLKRMVDREVDIGSARSNVFKPHLGAAVNNRWVDWWRLKRESPWGQRIRPLQKTIDLFLKSERAIANNPQRRAVFYNLVRKEAFHQIDRDMGHLNGLWERMGGILTMGPREQMIRVLESKPLVEEFTRTTSEVLGDFTTFTALERATLGRFLFFYPYLRYSLRMAFWTLPVHHPVRLAILANLSALTAKEQRELTGADPEDAFLLAGRYFYRGEDGKLYEYNVRSLNPLGNVVSESHESEDFLQLLPPIFTIGLSQIQKRDIYRGRDWRIHETADRRELEKITMLDRTRILGAELLRLPPITRELYRYMLPGEQGNDSLPFSERRTQFKDEIRQAQAEERYAREHKSLFRQLSENQLRFFFPKESDIENVLGRRKKATGRSGSTGGGPIDYSKAVPVGAASGEDPYSKAVPVGGP